jgi:hypothetical protein
VCRLPITFPRQPGASSRSGDACTLFHLLEIISVDEVKTYKPAPVVYELAVKKTGVDKGNIGFYFREFPG